MKTILIVGPRNKEYFEKSDVASKRLKELGYIPKIFDQEDIEADELKFCSDVIPKFSEDYDGIMLLDGWNSDECSLDCVEAMIKRAQAGVDFEILLTQDVM